MHLIDIYIYIYNIVMNLVMSAFVIPSGKRLHNYGKIHHAING